MNRTRAALLAFGAVAALASSPAAGAPRGEDVRCLMVSNIFSKNATDPKAKQVARSAMIFYGGRVSASPGGEVEAAMTAQTSEIAAANAGAIMKRCAQAMDQGIKSIQAAGQKLQAAKP